MVDFGQATYIDGTVIPGAELRRNTQRDAGEGSGVARPGDLKITQMDTPGAGVKIAVGDALIQSRAPGAGRETYGVPLVTSQNYVGDAGSGLPGTGSSVPVDGYRRDMFFLEVLDPGLPTFYTPQAEWPAGQSVKLSVIQNVGPTARRIEDVPALANVTGLALAAAKYPPSTATVTDAMLEDLREVHSPRSKRVLRAVNLSAVQRLSTTAAYPTGGTTFPAEFTGEAGKIRVPLWATRVRVVMTWGSVRFAGTSTAAGLMWVQMGQNVHPDVRRTNAGSFDANPGSRDTWIVADTIDVPESMRGTDEWFFPRANLEASQSVENQPFINTTSSLVLDVEFFGDAV